MNDDVDELLDDDQAARLLWWWRVVALPIGEA